MISRAGGAWQSFFNRSFSPGCETKFFESFPSARNRVSMVSGFLDNTARAKGKAALARPHSKTWRHLGRAA
jgi:hypothetical protein